MLPRTLATDRLVLRAVTLDDAATVHAGVVESLDDLRAWPRSLPWAASEPSLDSSADFCSEAEAGWRRGDDFALLILRAADGAHVGNIGLHRPVPGAGAIEIGYWCRPSGQGQGYVTEAVRALAAAALADGGFRRILCLCESENHRSRAVAQRAGFALLGIETVGTPPFGRCRYARDRPREA